MIKEEKKVEEPNTEPKIEEKKPEEPKVESKTEEPKTEPKTEESKSEIAPVVEEDEYELVKRTIYSSHFFMGLILNLPKETKGINIDLTPAVSHFINKVMTSFPAKKKQHGTNHKLHSKTKVAKFCIPQWRKTKEIEKKGSKKEIFFKHFNKQQRTIKKTQNRNFDSNCYTNR